MVHGLAFAGYHAACEVFNVAYEATEYMRWLREHCRESALEVRESVSLDLFWRELLNALESDAGRSMSTRGGNRTGFISSRGR